jgi:hypothetical protein
VRDDHASFFGTTTHENGVLLYQSNQVPYVSKASNANLYTLYFLALYASSSWYNMFLLPFLVFTTKLPRRITTQRYFCWHAELLPHTEQVVFHKSGIFGEAHKTIVDIKNLQKVSPEIIVNPLMWSGNIFDSNMVFQDSQSKEIFVFDKQGIWNESALKHPLLY